MHPVITVNEIERLILGFVKKLDAVKNLIIIDPYFYSSEATVLALFEHMIGELSSNLKSVTLFTANAKAPCRQRLKNECDRLFCITLQ